VNPPASLLEVFADARRLGFLGPEGPQRHIEHAAAYVAAAEAVFGPDGPAAFLDLGSGAGVPGLVLVERWPGARATLLDGSQRRAAFLRGAVVRLGFADRVTVVAERAEEAGRRPELREAFDLVVARSFGPPAVTAELASPFVRVGGAVLVSEPPDATGRWSVEGLGELGFARPVEAGREPAIVRLPKVEPLVDRFPRRTGVPGKRPLW
jgi:16S rRNA G527 N7-methylase RsmG